MYDELIQRLRASCESCKLWDGYKCCLKCECSAQTRLQAADVIEILQTLSDELSKIIAEMGAKYQETVNAVGELEKDKDFLNFLWNTIQPNEMEAYLSMYNAGSEKEES